MIKNILKNKKNIFSRGVKGYTVMELLVYLSIFTITSSVIINSLLLSMRLYKEARTNREFTEQGSLVMERISRGIRSAVSVNSASSTLSSSPGVLALNGASSTTMKFDVSSNALRLTESGTVTGNLTGGRISISALTFYYATTTVGAFVKSNVTLTDSISGRSESFNTTNILRNAY